MNRKVLRLKKKPKQGITFVKAWRWFCGLSTKEQELVLRRYARKFLATIKQGQHVVAITDDGQLKTYMKISNN